MNESIYRLGDEVQWFSPFQNRVVKGVVVAVYAGDAEQPYIIINLESGANPILPLRRYFDGEREYQRHWRNRHLEDVRRYQRAWARKKRERLREAVKEV